MSATVPTRLAAFSAALAAAFGGAVGLGSLLDPTDEAPRAGAHGGSPSAHGAGLAAGAGAHGDRPAGHARTKHAAPASALGGLSSVQDGLRLVPATTRLTAGRRAPWGFRIEDARGRVVRSGYEVESERELHLVVVRRDGTGFSHLHPRRAADGTWSTALSLDRPGSHRVLADFVVGGVRRTLGVDVEAGGDYRPAPPATPSPVAAVDGFRVTLPGAAPRAGRESSLRFRVTRAGRPVAALQPYLGARGHLVALREGDLGYLHVHPTGDGAPGQIRFAATFPSPGRYRLFLQFRTDGVVRTAPLVVEVVR